MCLIMASLNYVCCFSVCLCVFVHLIFSTEPICRTLRISPAASTMKCTVCVALMRTTCRPMGSLSTTQPHMRSSAFIHSLLLYPSFLFSALHLPPHSTLAFSARDRISMKWSQLILLRRACYKFIPHAIQHTTFPCLLPAFSNLQTEEWRGLAHPLTHTHTHVQCSLTDLIHMSTRVVCVHSTHPASCFRSLTNPQMKRPKCGACKMYTPFALILQSALHINIIFFDCHIDFIIFFFLLCFFINNLKVQALWLSKANVESTRPEPSVIQEPNY